MPRRTNSSTVTEGKADALLGPPPAIQPGDSLFLDVDGTLIDIADTPASVRVAEGLPALLERISAALSGRLALVSGRDVEVLEELGFGHVERIGSHGLEHARRDGVVERAERPAAMDEVITELESFAHERPGMLVERKPLSVGLHFRQAPDRADEAGALARRLAADHHLKLQAGKMLFELRPYGAHKGSAITALMKNGVFSQGRACFVGDDVTDEDGFVAVSKLGGRGILVGPARPTAATERLGDVAAVHAWLEHSISELEQGGT